MSLFADDLVVSILEQDMFSAGSRGNSFVGCTSAAASILPQLASGASFSAQDAGAALLQQQQQADPQDGVAAFCARTPLLANMMGPSPRITPLDGGYINQVFKIAPEAGSGPAVLLKFAPPYAAAQPDMPMPQVCGVARGAEPPPAAAHAWHAAGRCCCCCRRWRLTVTACNPASSHPHQLPVAPAGARGD
jgi:hypothetical protein